MHLGNALRVLDEREAGMARLEKAVAAYRLALEERTRHCLFRPAFACGAFVANFSRRLSLRRRLFAKSGLAFHVFPKQTFGKGLRTC